ncbi:retrovirus-related pol polyprotein from transposon TNT 1-94, partial [Tanacetum coccineum]
VDNGLAFYNRELEQLCTKSGIARHLTFVNTPQQNAVAKRMNRTLIDKERTPKEMRSGHLGYLKGVKGYKLYRLDDESPQIVTSRNVVFNERCHGLNYRMLEEDETNQEDGDDEDAGD